MAQNIYHAGDAAPGDPGSNVGVNFGPPVADATSVNAPAQTSTSALTNAPVTFDAPLAQSTTVPVTFNAPTSTATTVNVSSQPQQQTTQTQTQTVPQATISATPQPTGIAGKAARWAQNVADDIKYGTDLTGVGSVLKGMGAHGVYSGNSKAVGDFMASLPLGLLKAGKGTAELSQSGQRWQGTKDVAGGLLDAATIPGSFVAPEAGELAGQGINEAGNAIASQASRAAKAVKAPFTVDSIQPELQNAIRQTLASVAKDAGVNVSDTSSIRDAAQAVSDAIKAKGSALYKQLDNALGGTRFQTFDDQIGNVTRALRNSAGIDPDQDGKLIERINDLESARNKAFEQAKAAGIDPKLIDKANAAWKQGSALEDLSRHLRMSASGMRPELAETGAKTSPEVLSTAKLFPRVNALYNSGRLQQALGESKAQDLLQAVDSAHLRALKIKANQKALKTAAKIAAYGVGYEALRHGTSHLLGE